MTVYFSVQARLVGAVAALCLAGCVSVLPTPETPAALYRLGPVEAISAPLQASVIIREPETIRIFAGEKIAATGSDGAIRLVENVEWADASTRLMQVTMLDLLNTGSVGFALTPGAGGRADYELDWRIADLSLNGQRATCRLELVLLDGRTRAPLKRLSTERSEMSLSAANEARARALVSAARAALRDAAEALAQDIAATTPD